MTVRVQREDFDIAAEIASLRLARSESGKDTEKDIGAVVSFIGQVRDRNDGDSVEAMTLEHYPGMTEKTLDNIVEMAKQRWDISDVLIIHRIGQLKPADQIVLVVVTSAHRKQAFSACEFVMDFLKTEAPFWKKERTVAGERWVEAKATDDHARKRWQ